MQVVNGKHYPYTEKGKAAASKAKKAKGMAGGGSVGYNARLDESMGGRSGRKGQSEKSRRDESEGMERSMGRRKFAGAGTMDVGRKKMARGGSVGRTAADSQGKGHAGSVRKYHASGGFQREANRPGGSRHNPRGFRDGGPVCRTEDDVAAAERQNPVRKYHASGGWQREANRPGGSRHNPRGYRDGGLVTMKSSNTTVRGPHGGTATAENTNQHKLNAMGKLKGQ